MTRGDNMNYFIVGIAGALIGVIVAIEVACSRQLIKFTKKPSLTKYVVFSIAMIIIYTVAEFTFALITGSSHDTLTTCFYACFGGEILSCALIKIFKLREEQQ